MKTITFLIELYFPMKQHSNYKSINRHNCKYWSNKNPHWMKDSHIQYPQKINVWAGIQLCYFSWECQYGALFASFTKSGIAYYSKCSVAFNNVWFQRDSALPHFGINVRQLLNHTVPGKWISRRRTIEWPPRFPDLNPLTFLIHLKNLMFVTKPTNLDEFKKSQY